MIPEQAVEKAARKLAGQYMIDDGFGETSRASAEAGEMWRNFRKAAELALSAAAPFMAAQQPKWRHKKRGSIVTEVARGCAQVSHHPIEEMTAVVIYRHDDDGLYWVRNAVEFDDGRFEPHPLIADQRGNET